MSETQALRAAMPDRADRGRDIAVQALSICGAWVIVAAVGLFGVWIARLGARSSVFHVMPYLFAGALTAAVVIRQWRARDPRWTAGALALSAVAGAAVLAVDWESASVRLFYRLHRDDFAAVVALDAGTGLTPDSYYHALLPPHLDHLSIKGAATRIGSGTDAAVLFLPVWARYPKRPGGYAYLGNAAPAATYCCYDDKCRTRLPVGDGWYWLERDTPEWAR